MRTPMTKKTSRQLLEQSCAWILQHWNADNLDVPDELLEQWIYDPGEDEPEASGFQLAVFIFGHLQHDMISHNVPPQVKRTIALSQVVELFQKWQIKLALAAVHRRTGLRVKPLPLFAFPVGERIEAWANVPLNPQ